MTIREDIYTALKTLAGGQVYWVQAPDDVAGAYLVLTVINTQPENDLASELATQANIRLQVDVWGRTAKASDDLVPQVDAAMAAGAGFSCVQINDLDAYEPQQGIIGRTLEYSVWLAQ